MKKRIYLFVFVLLGGIIFTVKANAAGSEKRIKVDFYRFDSFTLTNAEGKN